MGKQRKTRAKYRIKQRIRYTETRPELVVREMLAKMGYSYEVGKELSVIDDNGKEWLLKPDIVLQFGKGYLTIIEVDGPYHNTARQRRKTAWRDGLLIKHGYKVIHIDAKLTETPDFRMYLGSELKRISLLPSPNVITFAA